jgi:hypothetical protein
MYSVLYKQKAHGLLFYNLWHWSLSKVQQQTYSARQKNILHEFGALDFHRSLAPTNPRNNVL